MNSVPLSQINIGLLANQVGVTATNTLDLGERVHDLLLSLDVCVQQTQDLKVVSPLFPIVLKYLRSPWRSKWWIVQFEVSTTSGRQRNRLRNCIRIGSSTSRPCR